MGGNHAGRPRGRSPVVTLGPQWSAPGPRQSRVRSRGWGSAKSRATGSAYAPAEWLPHGQCVAAGAREQRKGMTQRAAPGWAPWSWVFQLRGDREHVWVSDIHGHIPACVCMQACIHVRVSMHACECVHVCVHLCVRVGCVGPRVCKHV